MKRILAMMVVLASALTCGALAAVLSFTTVSPAGAAVLPHLLTPSLVKPHEFKPGPRNGGQPNILGTPYEVAFQANTTDLWTVGDGHGSWKIAMMAGTSPSITAVPGGYEVAFQDSTGNLETVGTAGNTNWGLPMAGGTSPSITALTLGGFEVAFQDSTGNLEPSVRTCTARGTRA
jgi:hypothetical protein